MRYVLVVIDDRPKHDSCAKPYAILTFHRRTIIYEVYIHYSITPKHGSDKRATGKVSYDVKNMMNNEDPSLFPLGNPHFCLSFPVSITFWTLAGHLPWLHTRSFSYPELRLCKCSCHETKIRPLLAIVMVRVPCQPESTENPG